VSNHGSVVVAVMTYRRPDLLRACLGSITAQTTTDGFDVCVVDNDPEASARPVVEELAGGFGGSVTYLHETTPGIPFARNAAVEHCVEAGADWIAFIDDDEQAGERWLDTLLETAHARRADGVQGSVVPAFEPGGPAWVSELGFHDKPVVGGGVHLVHATTANLLLDVRRLVELAGRRPFAVELSDYGGSDSELTMRLTAAGAVLVGEPSAVVTEFIPLERQTVEWMSRRAARTTAGWVAFQRAHVSPLRFWLQRVRAIWRWSARSVMHQVRGWATHSEPERVKARLCAARARGQVLGIRSKFLPEYARSAGATQ
jgi:succinoglycan biosynthesis protein ExoM